LVANKKRQQQEAEENELIFMEDTDAPAPLIYKDPEQTEFDCGYCGVNTQVEYHEGEKNSLCKSCYTVCDNNFTYDGEFATVRPDVENLDNSPITQVIVAKKLKRKYVRKAKAVVVTEPVVPVPEPIVVAQKPKRKYVRKPKAVVVPEPVVPEPEPVVPEPEPIVVAPKPQQPTDSGMSPLIQTVERGECDLSEFPHLILKSELDDNDEPMTVISGFKSVDELCDVLPVLFPIDVPKPKRK
jgi:hypothetical protein